LYLIQYTMNKETTLEETINKNKRYIQKLASTFGQNSWVDDLIQEGKIAIAKAYSTYTEDKGTFHAYAITLIRYAMMDYLSKNARMVRIPNHKMWDGTVNQKYTYLDQQSEEGNSIDLEDVQEDNSLDDAQTHQRTLLMNSMGNLKEEYQKIIMMRVIEDKTFKEIADVIGTTRQDVCYKYQTAISKLKKKLTV